MSYEDHLIKPRSKNSYIELIYKNQKSRKTKNSIQLKNNLLSNEKAKDENKFIRYRNKKILTIAPLFSSLDSTMTSSQKHQNDEDNPIKQETPKITLKTKKLVLPKDEDMAFLYDIFFGNNESSSRFDNKNLNININSNYTKRTSFNINNYDFDRIKKYLIKLQKKFCFNENLVNSGCNKNIPFGIIRDTFQLLKLKKQKIYFY